MSTRFLTLDDLDQLPPPHWLIEGMFEAQSLVMLAGSSYSFKSFLLLDWLLCMASGRNWQGKTTMPCKVGYSLGEGKSSLLKRVQAWQHYNELTPEELKKLRENFRVTFEVPQLAHKASVDNMLADLSKEEFRPEVIAVDTFARSFVGCDENDAKDTGLWVEQADRLRQMGFAVIFLHHTKKNTEFGVHYRGSTAIMGAMDTAFTQVRDDLHCTLTTTKQKDHDELPPMRFRRVIVPVTGGETSCVLVPAPIVDSRFAEPDPVERDRVHELIEALVKDSTYGSDTERAKAVHEAFPQISEGAARVRISRMG